MATDRYYSGHGPISLRKLRNALMDLDTISQPSVGAGAGFKQTPSGIIISNERPQEFWAMIDGVMAAGSDQLNGAITTTSATSLTVDSAAAFPSAGRYAILIDSEIMIVTGGQGTTTWTVLRGKNGTTAATHLDNAPVTLTRRGYSWTKQGDEVGCFEDDNIGSTTNQTPAFESSGRADVPTGTIVKLRLGVGGEHYTFSYPSGSDIGCRMYGGTVFVSAGATTKITAFTTSYDTDTMVSSTERITIKTAGKYYIWGRCRTDIGLGAPSANSFQQLRLYKNGSTTDIIDGEVSIYQSGSAESYYALLQVFEEEECAINDYFELYCVNGDASPATAANAYFGARKVNKAG